MLVMEQIHVDMVYRSSVALLLCGTAVMGK
jgi:hypothetical protein